MGRAHEQPEAPKPGPPLWPVALISMYGYSYAEVGQDPAKITWRLLRGLRHSPPGPASSDDRRATFDTALEQAEQLLTAARDVGPATRPLLAFYGLSQAGRAIGAAASAATDQEFKLFGHGITTKNLDASSLADVEVVNSGKAGAFTEVARFLDAASLPNRTKLGDLWALLPDLAATPLPSLGPKRPLTMGGSQPRGSLSGQPTVHGVAISEIPEHLFFSGSYMPEPAVMDAEREQVTEFLSDYPTLSGFAFVQAAPGSSVRTAPTAPVRIEWENDGTTLTQEDGAYRRACGYREQPLVFPAIGGSASAAHPFLVWWALLFALSMLARYEPKVWAERIDVSSSPDAVAVEFMLDQALVMVPELTHRAILQVAS